MLKTRLLQAVCTVAMLAAVPALAQQQEQPVAGMGAPTANTQPVPPGDATTPAKAPAAKMGSDKGAMNDTTKMDSMHHRPMHRSAMSHPMHSMKSASSGDRAVNDLNEKSYMAAQKGQTFAAGGSSMSSGDMMKSGSDNSSMSSGKSDVSGGKSNMSTNSAPATGTKQ